MTDSKDYQPSVLFIDELCGTKNLTRNWLQKNGCTVQEVKSLFEAMEEISDFTVEHRHDVVLLNADLFNRNFADIIEMFHGSLGATELPIFALAEENSQLSLHDGKKSYSAGNYLQLKELLNTFVAPLAQVA